MPRRPDACDILNCSTQSILEHLLGARLTGKPVVECEFESLLAVVVYVGKSNEVPCHFTGRVETPIFPQYIYPRELHGEYLVRRLGAQVTLQIQKFLVHAARNSAHQLIRIDLENTRQFRHTINCR